jgi:hypothetical protein
MTEAAQYLHGTLAARERGRVDECLYLSTVTQYHAEIEKDWDTLWRALTCPGMLYLGRGEAEAARPWFRMAMETAKSAGLTRRIAGSAHDLYVVGCDVSDRRAMKHFGAVALEVYPRDDPSRAVLSSDLTLSDLTRGENAAYALRLWTDVHARADCSRTRLLAATWLVVSAAHLGVDVYYTRALAALSSAVQGVSHGENVAISMNRAVEAMLTMRDFERAFMLAGAAELAATVRGEALQRERAAWLKDQAVAARVVRMP